MDARSDPMHRLASHRRAFGEYGGVNPSIEISTTFTVLDASTMPAIFAGERGPDKGACYLYGRSFSPSVRALGRDLAALEHTEAGYACASGMSAIATSILALCNSGDHVVSSNTVYGGTHALFKTFLPHKCNINVTFVDITDLDAVAAAFTDKTKVLYTESVSNPTLVVADLPALAGLAHSRSANLVVDNTFAPLIITPADWGADVVVHSMTKFMSGNSDIIAGAVCGSQSFIQSLMDLHEGPMMLLGPTMDPRIASELQLRLAHLAVRVKEHSTRAGTLAVRLEALGARVVYPGLRSHAQHRILAKLGNPGYGFGGLMGLDMGTPAKAEALMERLQNKHSFGLMAVSLGYVDTLMSLSSASTSSELSDEDKAAAHISDGYVRMSIGITGTLEQRWEQLREAYTFVRRYGTAPPYRATRMRLEHDGARTKLESWPSLGPDEDDELLLLPPSAIGALRATPAISAACGGCPLAGSDGGGGAVSGVSAEADNTACCGLMRAGSQDDREATASPALGPMGGTSAAAQTVLAGCSIAAAAAANRAACGDAYEQPPPRKVRRVTADTEIVYEPLPAAAQRELDRGERTGEVVSGVAASTATAARMGA